MKFLALLFVIGCASASIYDALDRASDDVMIDFLIGMDKTPALRNYIGARTYSEEAEELDQDIKTELGKTLKESLDTVLEKIRGTIEHGKEVSQELANKAKEIAGKLAELGQDAGSKAKELAERIKQKAKDWLNSLLEKIGLGKRGLTDFISNLLEQINIEALFQKLKDKISEKVNIDGIRAYIQKLFGESSLGQALLETLKTKGIAAIRALIGKILPSQLSGADYSLVETWENIKAFFKDLKGQVSEHFAKFSEWLKDTVKGGFSAAKDKVSNLKEIAKEVIAHGKTMSKEAAREALEFLEPYKKDLGSLWDDLKEAARNAIGRTDN